MDAMERLNLKFIPRKNGQMLLTECNSIALKKRLPRLKTLKYCKLSNIFKPTRQINMKIIVLVLLSLLLACTTEIPTTPEQKWGEYTFRLEARPPIITKGMIELLLISNFKEKLRGWDLVVYYRIGPTGKWVQAIQDGHTGVYRRAMRINDPETDVLYVHVKKKDKEVVFEYPLNYSTGMPSNSGS